MGGQSVHLPKNKVHPLILTLSFRFRTSKLIGAYLAGILAYWSRNPDFESKT